jgi:hypothetical protein
MSEHAESANTASENNLWLSRFRWFFAELTVVVVGILLALGLQSWWQTRENDTRGDAYQRQVLADVKQTRATYQKAIATDAQLRNITAQLIEALHTRQTLEGEHAMTWLAWRSGWFADPRPVVGNVYALIDTGDIQLIANPKVRAAIVEYASILKGGIADIDGQPDRMRRANDSELLRFEEAGLPPKMGLLFVSDKGKYEGEFSKDYLKRYNAAWPVLSQDPHYRNVQNLRILAYDNMTSYHKEILAASEKLIAILEADISQQ